VTKGRNGSRPSGKGTQGEETRARLIKATVELLQSHSVIELAATDITARAGLSNAAFYVYFSDVYDALLEAAETVDQSDPELLRLFDQPWTTETARDRATRVVERYFVIWDAHRPVLRARNLAADEGLRAFVKQRQLAIRPLQLALERQIASSQESGRLPGSLEQSALANALVALLDRTGAARPLYEDFGPDWKTEYAAAVVHIVLSGLGFAKAP
jgi:AcrR family transcriptional regulator